MCTGCWLLLLSNISLSLTHTHTLFSSFLLRVPHSVSHSHTLSLTHTHTLCFSLSRHDGKLRFQILPAQLFIQASQAIIIGRWAARTPAGRLAGFLWHRGRDPARAGRHGRSCWVRRYRVPHALQSNGFSSGPFRHCGESARGQGHIVTMLVPE